MVGAGAFRGLQAGLLSLAVSFEPGVSYATWVVGSIASIPRIGAVGLELPVDLRLGLALTERTTLGFRVELPFFFEFWSRDGGALSPQPLSSFAYLPRGGVGIEHAVSRAVMLFLHVRLGLLGTIDGQLGLAWRLPVG